LITWGALAENVAQSLTKGDRVLIGGRLDQRTWETEAGERRSKIGVVADEVAASLRWAAVAMSKNDRPIPVSVPANGGNYKTDEEPF
jgi:single-strand DNA-binding protein